MCKPRKPAETSAYPFVYPRDFRDIMGQELAKQALEIAAAGEHDVLMSGPPGCGKSLLAETFPSILPSLTHNEQLEVMSLYQFIEGEPENPANSSFSNPHHSAI